MSVWRWFIQAIAHRNNCIQLSDIHRAVYFNRTSLDQSKKSEIHITSMNQLDRKIGGKSYEQDFIFSHFSFGNQSIRIC